MGIPKFFRSMSERYPLISQLVEENKIPEFDNLYLDMNGIIHNCSHPNDGDATFRITEQDIFLAIFGYIDHIFTKIKPHKLFFLAVDGVAPRAKMNQQRSRRFRTAKEAKEIREKAERKGEEMPEEEAFDSNCITPGTPFMARLSQQLKYFLAKKVTEDANWQGVEIVLSGHEVPGEGEHKIMEYIRLAKAQPNYNPNVRHCLYGLDADLVMLGLLSHDPHFALLREEVNFGPQRKKKGGLEAQNFFLLHLSLFREYLDLEFQDLRSILPFAYSLEHIIDDFILLNIFVGNDFLPHLPGIHINEGALPMLFAIYKRILPTAGGYLNEDGNLRVDRLQLVLQELTKFEKEQFENEFADSNWFKGKQEKPNSLQDKARAKGKLVLTTQQRQVYQKVRAFIMAQRKDPDGAPTELFLAANLPARERQLVEDLAKALGLGLSYNEYDPEADAPATALTSDGYGELAQDAEAIEESAAAIDRVLKKYDNAQIVNIEDEEDAEAAYERKLKEKMDTWKSQYYREKLDFDYSDKEALRKLAYRYVEGLQWVLHYYYDGVASWGWFYDYHYAPKISDLLPVLDMTFNFELGKPFRPFDQLMGVLPALSSQHIPEAFRDLMTDAASPIIDFYPQDFEADLNGKKQDWEAVVKIPFIDEKRLLATLDRREPRLTADERARNTFGESTRLTYDAEHEYFLQSSLPGVFPDVVHSHAKMEEFHLPTLDGLHLVKGLCDGVELGERALAGFPSIKTLPHYARISRHGVNVFQAESKGDSVVVHVENKFDDSKAADIAAATVGRRTFTHWPFLTEGLVKAVSDPLFRYEQDHTGRIISTPHAPDALNTWKRKAERIEHHYSKRYGVITGHIDVLLHIHPLKGLKRMDDGSFVKDYNESVEIESAVQMSVGDVVQEDSRTVERQALDLTIEFPELSKVFFLGEKPYGAAAAVRSSSKTNLAVELAFFRDQTKENAMIRDIVAQRKTEAYYPSYVVAKKLGISGLALSKLTSSMLLEHNGTRVNVGLNLKFEAKNLKVLDYSRKSANGWEFSDKAMALVRSYQNNFPEITGRLSNSNNEDLRDATAFFAPDQLDARMRDLKAWIKEQGVRDLEAVPLFAEQLGRETVQAVERFTEHLAGVRAAGGAGGVKHVIIQGIPRTALLKPSHAPFRLKSQRFELGDRVIAVADTGNVPMAARGVVIGLNPASIEVVFDVPFLSGSQLNGRCSPYRGAVVNFDSVLNLTQPQFVASTGPPRAPAAATNGAAPPRAPANGAPRAQYRPPNAMRAPPHVAARPTGGVTLLQRNKGPGAAPVSPNMAFSGVADGSVRPSAQQAAAMASINPALAALGIGGSSSAAAAPAAAAAAPAAPARGGAPAAASRGRGASNGIPTAPRDQQPRGPTLQNGQPTRGFAPSRGRGGGGGRGRGRGGPPTSAAPAHAA